MKRVVNVSGQWVTQEHVYFVQIVVADYFFICINLILW